MRCRMIDNCNTLKVKVKVKVLVGKLAVAVETVEMCAYLRT